jgi:hypothetical protein
MERKYLFFSKQKCDFFRAEEVRLQSKRARLLFCFTNCHGWLVAVMVEPKWLLVISEMSARKRKTKEFG